ETGCIWPDGQGFGTNSRNRKHPVISGRWRRSGNTEDKKAECAMNPGRFALEAFSYCEKLLIEENLDVRLLTNLLTDTLIAIDIPAAIRSYSIAVAPESTRKNLPIKGFITFASGNGDVTGAP